MTRTKKSQEQIRLLIIAVCLILLASGGLQGFMAMSSIGDFYVTGYEGAKASFYGIEWGYESQTGKADFPLGGTMFHFDADENKYPRTHACNLVGEMTSVIVPQRSKPAGWLDSAWWDTALEIRNPIEEYEWQIPTDSGEIIAYSMKEYQCKWYFSISAEWDEISTLFRGDEEKTDQRYRNTRIWFEFNIQPTWYFEGADHTYFAIAKIKVGKDEVALGGKLNMKDPVEKGGSIRVNPMSSSSLLTMYYTPYGGVERPVMNAYEVQGKKLNPDYFTNKLYTYFTLEDFGTREVPQWGGLAGYKYIGDVVTVGFDVHIFAVGEWKVQDIQELPEDYGKTPQIEEDKGILSFLADLIGDPRFQLWSFIGIIALVILVLAIFAPWVLFGLIGLFKYSKGGKK